MDLVELCGVDVDASGLVLVFDIKHRVFSERNMGVKIEVEEHDSLFEDSEGFGVDGRGFLLERKKVKEGEEPPFKINLSHGDKGARLVHRVKEPVLELQGRGPYHVIVVVVQGFLDAGEQVLDDVIGLLDELLTGRRVPDLGKQVLHRDGVGLEDGRDVRPSLDWETIKHFDTGPRQEGKGFLVGRTDSIDGLGAVQTKSAL